MTLRLADADLSPLTRARVRPTFVSRCTVDAAGVPAEWVEVTAAFSGQPTLVWFAEPYGPEAGGADSLSLAAGLAVATRARVLLIGSGAVPGPPRTCIDEGVAAWSWLLGEGCDARRAAFVTSFTGRARVIEALQDIQQRELVGPGAGAWCYPTGNAAALPARRRADLCSLLTHVGAVRCAVDATRCSGVPLTFPS